MCSPVPINITGLFVAATLEKERKEFQNKVPQILHLLTIIKGMGMFAYL